jgi:SAM-dependent methyltransferase
MSGYTSEAAPDHQHSGGENLEVMRDAHKYNRFLKDLIRRHAGNARTVLDFGAGIGTFSGSVDLPHEQIHCVEPDAASQRHLSAKGYIAHDNISEIEDASIDYVFTLNVLEHIEDDAAALSQLYRVIKPGGRLLIYVPAFMVLYASMDAHVGHHRRYRLAPLRNLVREAGFEIEKSAYSDALGFFATLALKCFESSDPAPLNPKMVGFYDRYFFPLSRLLSIPCAKILGKNVYVAAHRPLTESK